MEKNIIQIVKESYSKSEVIRKLGFGYINGNTLRKITILIEQSNLDISHFKLTGNRFKYELIEQVCPICDKEFPVRNDKRNMEKPQVTCSRGCANTYFRSKEDNPNWKGEKVAFERRYRRICFNHHEKKCIICKENNIVAVHHYDENRRNNLPENLLPLCPTHHIYMHSKYKDLIQVKIDQYVKEFSK